MGKPFTDEQSLSEMNHSRSGDPVLTEMAELLRIVSNYGTRLEFGEEWSRRVDTVLAQVSSDDTVSDD